MRLSKTQWAFALILWLYGNSVYLFSPPYPGRIPKLIGGLMGDILLVYIGAVLFRIIKSGSRESV